MPLCADPSRLCWFPLKIDESLPPESRPEFAFRFSTSRERAAMLDAVVAAEKKLTYEDTIRELLTVALPMGLRGWKNLGIEYNAADLSNLREKLTDTEISELAKVMLIGPIAGEIDLKKSQSLAASAPASASSGSCSGTTIWPTWKSCWPLPIRRCPS